MLLRTKFRKQQLGGALNQAQNAYAPIDIKWKQFDIAPTKGTNLNLPKASGSSSGSGTGDDGLPSDVAYVDQQLTNARQVLRDKLTGPNGKDYTATIDYKNDMAQINKWATVQSSMLKARADDYKSTKTRLQKNAGDDLAIFNGQALALDNTDGQYKIVDEDQVLTERIKADNGVQPKYTPATIGTALQLRLSNPEFSGFNEDKGEKLEKILSSVSDKETVDKEMADLFSKAGSIDESASTFTSVKDSGNPHSIMDLANNLKTVSESASRGIKSNESTLRNAVDLFKSTVSPIHLEALKNNAIAKYIEQNGNKEVNASSARQWVDAQVDGEIAKRASIYLKTLQSKKSGTTLATGSDDLGKKKIETNETTMYRMSPGSTLQIEGGYDEAKDVKKQFNMLGTVMASEKPIVKNIIEGSGPKGAANHLNDNAYIRTLTGDKLEKNLFLADGKNTPVNHLNDGEGLKTSMPNITPSGGTMKILHSMPYTIDEDGNYGIAWGDIKKAMKWGETLTQLTKDKYKELGLDPKQGLLSSEIRDQLMAKASEMTGFNGNNDKRVHVGDIAMIPILVSSPEPGWESKLGNVLSSNVSKDERDALKNDLGFFSNHKPYKTFAFTVMSDSPAATLNPKYYGKADEMPAVSASYILGIHATNHRLTRQGADFLQEAIAGGSIDQTIQ